MSATIDNAHRQTSRSDEFLDLAHAFLISQRATAVVDRIKTPVDNRRPVVSALKLYNAGGGAISCGIGPEYEYSRWNAGTWDDAAGGDDYTDASIAAQNETADDFTLNVTGTNNDGHVILCKDLWSACHYVVGTASGAGSVEEYMYFNGSAWAALTTLNEPDFSATGITHLLFEPPEAWALTTAIAPGEGVPADYYAIRVRSTTAPAAPSALASYLRIGHPLEFGFYDVPAGGRGSYEGYPIAAMCRDGEGLMSAFGTHTSGNGILVAGEDYLL